MKFPRDYTSLVFEDGGRNRPSVDCWGLVCLVYREQLGIHLPTYGEIGAMDLLSIARMVNSKTFGGDWEEKDKPSKYDVVVMSAHDKVRGNVSRVNSHVGIMVNDRQVMHIESGNGVMIVDITSPYVKNRIVGIYEYVK